MQADVADQEPRSPTRSMVRLGLVAIVGVLAAVGLVRVMADDGPPAEVSAFKQHMADATTTAQAVAGVLPSGTCRSAEDLPALPSELGTFAEVCSWSGVIRFGAVDPNGMSFAYGPGPIRELSVCTSRIAQDWWAITQDGSTASCPSGFHFQAP